jgi:hypothetical protein
VLHHILQSASSDKGDLLLLQNQGNRAVIPAHEVSFIAITTRLPYSFREQRKVSFIARAVLENATLRYGYEHFLEQVNLAEQLTSSDFGISTGLINQNYWENSKWYYVNVELGVGNASDKLTGRNINLSFQNNSNVPIEVMIFTFFSDKITFDVKTGLVTRHKN